MSVLCYNRYVRSQVDQNDIKCDFCIKKIGGAITQLNKLKSAAKNKTGTILRINRKNFQDEELPHNFL